MTLRRRRTTTSDVLVATHEHWDHISGFHESQAQKKFDKFNVDQVWLAWTEDPKNAFANKLRESRKKNLAAFWHGIKGLETRLGADASPASKEALAGAGEVLAFFGIDLAKDTPPAGGFGAAPLGAG